MKTASFFKSLARPTQLDYLGLALAVVVLIVTVLQLFSFEHFARILAGIDMPIPSILAVIIVTIQGGSLPFLLGMDVNHWITVTSYYVSRSLAVLWILLASFGTMYPGNSSAFGGATIKIAGGWLLAVVVFIVALVIMYFGLAKTETIRRR